jgi:hypothetical protein
MPAVDTVPVAERALVARIDRTLRKEGQAIRRCRQDSRSAASLGRYYLIDGSLNAVTATHVDIESLGRELGLLKAWERLAED